MEGALPVCGLAVPRELIAVAVRMYLRFGAPSRRWGVARERDIAINQVNVFRRMHTFTPKACKAAGPHSTRWNQNRPRGAYRSASAWAFGLCWLNRTTYR